MKTDLSLRVSRVRTTSRVAAKVAMSCTWFFERPTNSFPESRTDRLWWMDKWSMGGCLGGQMDYEMSGC